MAEEKESKDPAEAAANKTKKSVGTCEVMGCCALNLGCFFLILAGLSLVSMIVGVMSNPLEAVPSIISDMWGSIFK